MKLCVDIGATNIKSGIIEDGRLLRTAVTPTDTSHGLEGIVESLARAKKIRFILCFYFMYLLCRPDRYPFRHSGLCHRQFTRIYGL